MSAPVSDAALRITENFCTHPDDGSDGIHCAACERSMLRQEIQVALTAAEAKGREAKNAAIYKQGIQLGIIRGREEMAREIAEEMKKAANEASEIRPHEPPSASYAWWIKRIEAKR